MEIVCINGIAWIIYDGMVSGGNHYVVPHNCLTTVTTVMVNIFGRIDCEQRDSQMRLGSKTKKKINENKQDEREREKKRENNGQTSRYYSRAIIKPPTMV